MIQSIGDFLLSVNFQKDFNFKHTFVFLCFLWKSLSSKGLF